MSAFSTLLGTAPAGTPRNRFAATPDQVESVQQPYGGQSPLASLSPQSFFSMGNANGRGTNLQPGQIAPTASVPVWTPPKLDANGHFTSQQDIEDFKAAFSNTGMHDHIQPGSLTGATMRDPQAFKNNKAAGDFAQQQGWWHPPAGGAGGIRGAAKDFGDSVSGYFKNVILSPPVLAAATAGVGAALGAGAGAAAGAGEGAGVTAATEGATQGITAAEAAAGQSLVPSAGSAFLAPATQSVVPGFSSSLLGGAAAGAGAGVDLAQTGVPGAGADTVAPGGVALDPTAAPAAELPPAPDVGSSSAADAGIGAGAGTPPSAAPSLASTGELLGKVGTFARDAMAIGGLLGGLAGLQGGKSPGGPEAPPRPPDSLMSQAGTQADAKADLQKNAQSGAPGAGIDTTWLTGMGGVPEDQLRLGRSTLLGQ